MIEFMMPSQAIRFQVPVKKGDLKASTCRWTSKLNFPPAPHPAYLILK